MGRREQNMPERVPPVRTKRSRDPEARENEMIALAVNLAEEQLRNGTASAQVITHYLKLGSSTERMSKQLMEKELELKEAKTSALKSQQRVEELYANALKAMREYQMPVSDDDSSDL